VASRADPEAQRPARGIVSRTLKRALDVALAGGALVAMSPVLGAIAALELRFHGWPPIFAQKRPGLNGRIFTLYKFRTMTDARSPNGELLPDRDRLTRFGSILRATSLDELPELFNVVRGDMSLVGPRPLLARYLPRYSPRQRRRHEVRPGITGWAQVNGRNSLAWEKRFELDVWYVDNWSLALDAKILALTLWTVLRRDGISAEGEVTMFEFWGSEGPPENTLDAAKGLRESPPQGSS
jgi:sugar transferase EpsL